MKTAEEARNEGWETWLDSGTLSFALEGVFNSRAAAQYHFEREHGKSDREGNMYRIRRKGDEYGLYVY